MPDGPLNAVIAVGPWEKIPAVARGICFRRWRWETHSIGGAWDGDWEYATLEQSATLTLEETYGNTNRRIVREGKPRY